MIDYVIIRNADREKIGIVDVFTSLLWVREYYGAGMFELYAPVTASAVELLQKGNYVSRPDDDNIGIIEQIAISYTQTEGRMMVASGRFAKSILDRRLIYSLSGTSNKATVISGNVEAGARKLVNNNIIASPDSARNIDFIKLGALSGISKTIVSENGLASSKQTSYDNLLEFSDGMLKEYKCGSYMRLNDDTLDLEYIVYEGKDRSVINTGGNQPVIFSQEFDNLLSSDYNYNGVSEKTTALVGGEGEGVARFYSLYGGSKKGMARKEVFVDASSINKKYTEEEGEETIEKEYSNTEYREMLLTKARQEVEPMVAEESFSGMVDVTHLQYRYRVDFDLGDKVTVRDDEAGFTIHPRIVTTTEIQDGNGYNIEVAFETET